MEKDDLAEKPVILSKFFNYKVPQRDPGWPLIFISENHKIICELIFSGRKLPLKVYATTYKRQKINFFQI